MKREDNMVRTERHSTGGIGLVVPMLVLLIVEAVLCVVLPSVLDAIPRGVHVYWLSMFFVGAFLGTIGLLTIWAVLGTHRWPIRQFLALLAITELCGALSAGFAIVESRGADQGFRLFLVLLGTVPLMFVAAQTPLWACRVIRGWQIVSRDEGCPASLSRRGKYGTGHLVAATLMVAFAFAVARWAHLTPQGTIDWAEVLGVVAGVFVWSLLVLMPTVWSAMGWSNFARAFLFLGGCSLLLTLAFAVVAMLIMGAGVWMAFVAAALYFGSVALGTFSVLLSGLWLARHRGFVLANSSRASRR